MQRRSAERLARILDACAELLDETGYEELSTRAVAVRAGVPIGSVYRFFGNKRALADALADAIWTDMPTASRTGSPVSPEATGVARSTWCSTSTWP